METQKIGKFLKELRKDNHLTQEQLGERIGVTNKTVSRWETGNYMPPVESLKLLSDIYQISINEILAGEKLKQEEFKDTAEKNISVALEEIEAKDKKFEKKMMVIMAITSFLAIVIIMLLPKGVETADKIKAVIIILLVVAMAFISNTLNIVALVMNKEKGTKRSI